VRVPLEAISKDADNPTVTTLQNAADEDAGAVVDVVHGGDGLAAALGEVGAEEFGGVGVRRRYCRWPTGRRCVLELAYS
jgi:hypothetical protein